MAESVPQEGPIEEVLAVMPDDGTKSSLEKDAELFIQEEDDLEEKLELPIHRKPTQPPIELKVLPTVSAMLSSMVTHKLPSSLVVTFLTRRRLNS